MKKKLLLIIMSIYLVACQSNESNQRTMNEEETNNKVTKKVNTNIKVSPCPPLPEEANHEEVVMETYTYERSQMMFGVRNIRLGGKTPNTAALPFFTTSKGTHLHLNIDNKRHHRSNRNVFEYDLPDGKYQLFSFINRSYYIAIKNSNSLIAKEIEVKNKQLKKSKNLESVALVYNAPHGLYKNEEADKIVLDFLLYNTEIEVGGNSVRVSIDGQVVLTTTEHQPYYIEGLEKGEHICQLELLNSQGQAITEPVSNKFVVTNHSNES